MTTHTTIGNSYFYFVAYLPAIRQMAGWQSIRLFGKRFQLHGGIRTPYFVNLARPLGRTK